MIGGHLTIGPSQEAVDINTCTERIVTMYDHRAITSLEHVSFYPTHKARSISVGIGFAYLCWNVVCVCVCPSITSNTTLRTSVYRSLFRTCRNVQVF